MNNSLRYRICYWLMMLQILLCPILYIISAFDRIYYAYSDCHDTFWQWNLPTWILIFGFCLGLIIFPLSIGIKKGKLMKWWLITDFVVSLILAIPFFYIAPTIFRQYWVEKDGYVMYSQGRFFAEPIACLGKKSGMRIYGLPCKLPEYNNEYINPENFHVDLALGCCYGISNGDEAYVWMCPLDSTTYHHNANLINQKIDSIAANNKFTYGRFILPDDFSKLIYAKSHINYYNSMSSLDWYVSNCLIDFYPNRRDNSMKPDIDSVKIKYFKDRFETIMVPRDSVPSDDPIILRAFLRRKFDI